MAISNSSESGDYALFDELAEEFAERYRRGERPSLQEYVERCPEMGDEIRELFPALVEVEQAEEVLEGAADCTAPPPTPSLRQIGDYRVIREVGRGGMGVVYEAEQISLGRRVALKVMPRGIAKDHNGQERFRREARAAARLHHTNIVPVFQVGQDGEVVFYAMQFIQGQGLDVVINELAHQRQNSGRASAAILAAGGEEKRHGPQGSTQQQSGAGSRCLPSMPVHARTEALAASLRMRQVSRMAQSLLTGNFATETLDPDRTGSSKTADAAGPRDGQATGALAWSFDGSSSSASSAPCSASAVLPGGTQVSAVESSGRRLPFFQSVARIGRQAAHGLAYAHARGVIHRDIKPSNLLLDTVGVVWIADFGLAKADDDGLTATGDILGTIRYMAPERFRGEGDSRADIYALGLTLYELLTLRPAFHSSDRLQIIERIKTEDPVRPRTLDSRVPRDLETIVLKAIDKDPRRRYATADALAEDLRRFLDDEPIQARRTTAAERLARWARRHPGIAVLATVLTAVLLLATAVSSIVAERMSRLANDQAKAAHEADLARGQEADQRALADQARLQAEARRVEADEQRHVAETSRAEALAQSRAAKTNFEQARKAVDDFFIKVSESKLKAVPGLRSLRAELLGSALGFYTELLKERAGDPSLRRDLLQSRFRAGRVLHELGRDSEAGAALRTAGDGYERELLDHPDDIELKAGLAAVMSWSAAIDPDPARKGAGLKRAIALREAVLKARPGDATNKLELADIYNSLANHWRDRADGDALSAYERSLMLKLELATATPDDPSILRGLSQAFNNHANLFDSNNTRGQVLAMYQQAIDLTREAIRLAPGDTTLARKILIVTTNLTRTLTELYRFDEAVAQWRLSIATLDSMARANPEVPDVHAVHLQASMALADSLLTLNANQANDAVRALLDAQEDLDHLSRETPEDLASTARQRVAFAERLRAIKPKLAREEALARDDQLDRAVDALRQAIAAGWSGLAEVQGASPLKSRPAYANLLAEAEAAAKISANSSAKTTLAALSRSVDAPAAPFHSHLDLRRSQAIALGAIGRARFQRGQIAPGREALERSLATFKAIRRERPHDPLALADVSAGQVVIGQVLWEAGTLEEADKFWRAARSTLATFPRNAGQRSAATDTALESWQIIARTYAQHGLYEEAAQLFEDAAPLARATLRERVALDLYDFNAICLRLRCDDTEAYRRACAKLVEQCGSSNDPVVCLLLAWATQLSPQSGVDPVRGLAWAHTAESTLDGGYLTLFARHVHALAYYRAGRWAEAIAKARESEHDWPDWAAQPVNWCVQAMASFRMGKTAEARTWLDRVEASVARMRTLLRNPSDLTALPSSRTPQWEHWRHPISWHEWISLELLHSEASQLIAGALPPDIAEDRVVRAVVYARLGDARKSEAELRVAVEEAPHAPSVWLTRSHAFRLLGHPAQARADLDQALKLPGGAVETWIGEYLWLLERGEHDLASRVLDRLRSVEPKTALGWAERAKALVAAGQFPEAAHDMAQAAKTDAGALENSAMDVLVIECIKYPVLQRRWADALALVRAVNASSRRGPTTRLESTLERIEANLLILTGDRAGFARHVKTILGRARAENETTLAGELAWACALATKAEVDPETTVELAKDTIAKRPLEEVWWHLPQIAGLVRAGRYESAIRALDDVDRISPTWDAATSDLLRAIAHHHLGHEAAARHWLAVSTRKMVAPSGSESVWSAWALAFVQDALSHEALHKEAVELILDPAFPANPFDPGP